VFRFRSAIASLTILRNAVPVKGLGDTFPFLAAARIALRNSPSEASLRIKRRTPSLTRSRVEVTAFSAVLRFLGARLPDDICLPGKTWPRFPLDMCCTPLAIVGGRIIRPRPGENAVERTHLPSHDTGVCQRLQYTEYVAEAESIKGMERGVVLLGEKEPPWGTATA
jgi:hypothetical protein